MTKLVWRYSDNARAIIENVYRFCVEEKESGMNFLLDHVCKRTAAFTGISDLPLIELSKRGRRHGDLLASDPARCELPEPVVINLGSDNDDLLTDTANEKGDIKFVSFLNEIFRYI